MNKKQQQPSKNRPRTAVSQPGKKKAPENDEESKRQEMIKREMMRHPEYRDGEMPLIFHKNEIFLIFETELEAEIFNSRCNDSGEVQCPGEIASQDAGASETRRVAAYRMGEGEPSRTRERERESYPCETAPSSFFVRARESCPN